MDVWPDLHTTDEPSMNHEDVSSADQSFANI
jgi:hypothetical protein